MADREGGQHQTGMTEVEKRTPWRRQRQRDQSHLRSLAMDINAYIGSASFNLPSLEQVTLAAFTFCNSIRVLAYLPQIRKAATDKHGADAISYTTWSLFLVAHISTVGYALVNRQDVTLAMCFGGNAICCVAILALAMHNKRRYLRRHRPAPSVRADGVRADGFSCEPVVASTGG